MSRAKFTTLVARAGSGTKPWVMNTVSSASNALHRARQVIGWYVVDKLLPNGYQNARLAQIEENMSVEADPVVVEKLVEVPVERVVEKIVEVEKLVEVPVEVEKVVEKIVEIEKIVEVIKMVAEAPPKEHTVYGQLLGEYGPKKVYSTPVKNFSSFGIWEKQRSFDAERAVELAEAKRSTLNHVGFPGSITVVDDLGDGQPVCVDGQNRLAAISQLIEEGLISAEERMTVEVFTNAEADMNGLASAVFVDINSCEPVKLVDLPHALEGAEKAALDEACVSLKKKYKAMFKPTSRCRPPHLHLDTLRDMLFEFGVVRGLQANDSDDLFQWLVEENDKLKKIKEDRWVAMRGKTAASSVRSALKKAKKHRFWLGMPGAMGLVLETSFKSKQ